MKTKKILTLVFLLGSMSLSAQTDEMKYLRSSLSMILLESDNFPSKDAVMKSWNNYPFPDKYNQHDISSKSIDIDGIKLTDEDLKDAGFLKDTLSGLKMTAAAAIRPVRYLNDEKTSAFGLPTEKQEYEIKITKVIKDKKIANQLVASWFVKDGKTSSALMEERGSYNATEMDAAIAAGKERGSAALADAGEQLIQNTFVTFTKLNFFENEPAAKLILEAAKVAAGELKTPIQQQAAIKAAELAYEKAKDGYSILSKTWLYKLSWSASEMNHVWDLWDNPEGINKSDSFNLEFIGSQYNTSLVLAGDDLAKIIDKATVRNIDKAFAKLQKQNDVFKPKIPVSSTGPIMAQIGMKEGISPGDKFEVLEMVWDEKAGKTTWNSVGKCSVDKKAPIWDNRYNAGDGPDTEVAKDAEGNPITASQFKGSKKIQVGMLLKQLK